MVLASSIYIYIRVYVDSHSLGQLALASKRTASIYIIKNIVMPWLAVKSPRLPYHVYNNYIVVKSHISINHNVEGHNSAVRD